MSLNQEESSKESRELPNAMRNLNESAELLRELLLERILVLDGAMGTMLQQRHLTAEDFGGAALEGRNDKLVWNAAGCGAGYFTGIFRVAGHR